jgi:hypothetical protein
MSKPPATNLAALTFARTAPRPAPPEAFGEIAPVVSVAAPPKRKPPGRRVLVGGHFEPEVSYALLSLTGKIASQRGEKVTVQAALAEGLRMLFERYGEPVPPGLNGVP